PELVEHADRALAGSRFLGEARGLPVIEPALTEDRAPALAPRPHPTFTVGYVGTVDPVKLHPGFVALSAGVAVPEARFVVCGDGAARDALRRDAARRGLADRF